MDNSKGKKNLFMRIISYAAIGIGSVIALIVAFFLLLVFGEVETPVFYGSPVWSIDGSKIYFSKYVGHEKNSFVVGPQEYKSESYLMVSDAGGLPVTQIMSFRNNYKRDTGRTAFDNIYGLVNDEELICLIAYQDDNILCKVNLKTKQITKMIDFGRIGPMPDVFISPDKKRLIYTKQEHDKYKKPTDDFSVWLCDVNGNNNKMISGDDSYALGWTRDGKIVVKAITDLEGKVRSEFDERGLIITDKNIVIDQIVVYDREGKEISKKKYIGADERDSILNSLNMERSIAISPDGKKQLLQHEMDILIKTIDTGKEVTLFRGRMR